MKWGEKKVVKMFFEWIKQVQDLGAGEIVLTSVDKDGTCEGPDLDLFRLASEISMVPLVVGGGFNKASRCSQVL